MAFGKRLAERNRLAREAKKKAEEAAKQASTSATPAQPSDNTPTPSTDQSSNSTFFILGVGGLIVSAAGVYYQREAIMKRLKPAPPAPAPEPAAPAPSKLHRQTGPQENGIISKTIYTYTMERALVALAAATLASLLYDWVDRRQKVACVVAKFDILHDNALRCPELRDVIINEQGGRNTLMCQLILGPSEDDERTPPEDEQTPPEDEQTDAM